MSTAYRGHAAEKRSLTRFCRQDSSFVRFSLPRRRCSPYTKSAPQFILSRFCIAGIAVSEKQIRSLLILWMHQSLMLFQHIFCRHWGRPDQAANEGKKCFQDFSFCSDSLFVIDLDCYDWLVCIAHKFSCIARNRAKTAHMRLRITCVQFRLCCFFFRVDATRSSSKQLLEDCYSYQAEPLCFCSSFYL